MPIRARQHDRTGGARSGRGDGVPYRDHLRRTGTNLGTVACDPGPPTAHRSRHRGESDLAVRAAQELFGLERAVRARVECVGR